MWHLVHYEKLKEILELILPDFQVKCTTKNVDQDKNLLKFESLLNDAKAIVEKCKKSYCKQIIHKVEVCFKNHEDSLGY